MNSSSSNRFNPSQSNMKKTANSNKGNDDYLGGKLFSEFFRYNG